MIVFFSACTAGDNQKLLANITDLYATAGEFDSRVSITVELPQRTATYVIDWQYAAGKSILTVAEPEQIAGITAETEDNGPDVPLRRCSAGRRLFWRRNFTH